MTRLSDAELAEALEIADWNKFEHGRKPRELTILANALLQLRDDLDAVTRERDADKRRLDFLSRPGSRTIGVPEPGKWPVCLYDPHKTHEPFDHDSLREAVDAAIAWFAEHPTLAAHAPTPEGSK